MHSGRGRPQGRILLVDDDADAALFTTHVLTALGQFTVTRTADPVAALQLVTRGDCDLLLTETELPGLSGLRLVASVRQVAPSLPVIVLTVHPLDGAELSALRELTDAYLVKPVPARRLIAEVSAAINRTR